MRRFVAMESMESRCMLSVTPTFAADANFYTGQGPVAVATGDFNRDGNLDFVTADSAAGTLTIRRGRGDGTFRPASTIAVGSQPMDVVAADFNKDGKLDLAVVLRGENRILSYVGDGAGGFTLKGSVGTGSLAGDPFDTNVRLVTGDFDNDGKLDLAVTNTGDGTVSVLRGKGSGAFYFRITTAVPAQSGIKNVDLIGLAAADLNGDGKTDLVASGRSNFVDVLLATGGGHFSLHQQITEGILGFDDPRDVVLAKLNGDNLFDMAFVSGGTDGVEIFIGTGGGSFVAHDSVGTGIWPNVTERGPIAIAAGDFNKDGSVDLAVANAFAGTRGILVNDGTAGFTVTSETPFIDWDAEPPVTSPYTPVDIVTGDFAKDGKIDVLAVNQNLNNVTLMKNTTA